jgi:hypothetical protein
MTIFAELFEENDFLKFSNLNLTRSKGLFEINNYYERINPNPKIYKFEFQIIPFTNGI